MSWFIRLLLAILLACATALAGQHLPPPGHTTHYEGTTHDGKSVDLAVGPTANACDIVIDGHYMGQFVWADLETARYRTLDDGWSIEFDYVLLPDRIVIFWSLYLVDTKVDWGICES